ncbi:PQQ-dependent sugar dehydrogenase, partial [Candidatus Gracilibacteria bacterium]|nr:PQQ-dependent sugar dehydrogenase [Candidatus Gracilibacteria bacterium]
MKYTSCLILLGILSSCSYIQTQEMPETTHVSQINEESEDIEEPIDTYSSVGELGDNPETQTPHTSLEPAFSGQTRVSGARTQSEYRVEEIADLGGVVWGITQLPNNNFLTFLRSGTIYLLSFNGDILQEMNLDLDVFARGQGGLLDVVLAPDYSESGNIFFSFSENYERGSLTSVGRGVLDEENGAIDSQEVIFRAIPSYNGDKHFGSRIAIDNNGDLFVSFGERSDRRIRDAAQDDSNYLGSIIHITQNGDPVRPEGYGFSLPEIYSIGHRNPQGLVYETETGKLWSSEMGPRGGDEINLIEPGKNYGWPVITYGEEYTGFSVGEGIGQQEGMEQPRYYWDPAVSPSGIDIYSGDIEEWRGNLFIANLSG